MPAYAAPPDVRPIQANQGLLNMPHNKGYFSLLTSLGKLHFNAPHVRHSYTERVGLLLCYYWRVSSGPMPYFLNYAVLISYVCIAQAIALTFCFEDIKAFSQRESCLYCLSSLKFGDQLGQRTGP
jgi:hypothetical protein